MFTKTALSNSLEGIYSAEHNSWEPLAMLVDVMDHVNHYNYPHNYLAPVFRVLGFRV